MLRSTFKKNIFCLFYLGKSFGSDGLATKLRNPKIVKSYTPNNVKIYSKRNICRFATKKIHIWPEIDLCLFRNVIFLFVTSKI